MKKILITLLFIISSSICASAAEPRKTSSAVEDPDLKLSIEELRKKYPINWLKKEYGDANHPSCGNSDGAFEYDGPIPNNLKCSFFTGSGLQSTLEPSVDFDNFSDSQIRSALVEYNKLWKEKKIDEDGRIREIVFIALLYFEQNSKITDNEKRKLMNFFYMSKLLPITQDAVECKYAKSIYKLSVTCPIK